MAGRAASRRSRRGISPGPASEPWKRPPREVRLQPRNQRRGAATRCTRPPASPPPLPREKPPGPRLALRLLCPAHPRRSARAQGHSRPGPAGTLPPLQPARDAGAGPAATTHQQLCAAVRHSLACSLPPRHPSPPGRRLPPPAQGRRHAATCGAARAAPATPPAFHPPSVERRVDTFCPGRRVPSLPLARQAATPANGRRPRAAAGRVQPHVARPAEEGEEGEWPAPCPGVGPQARCRGVRSEAAAQPAEPSAGLRSGAGTEWAAGSRRGRDPWGRDLSALEEGGCGARPKARGGL